jgi:hypothetical protein
LKVAAAADPADTAAKAAAVEVPTYMHGVRVVKTLDIGEYPTGLDAIMAAPSAVPPPPALEEAIAKADEKWGSAGYAEHIKERVWWGCTS